MATYAGVTFDIADTEFPRQSWARQFQVSERPIPFAEGADDTQYLGYGPPQIERTILLSSPADLDTLYAAVGTTTRTLGDFRGADVPGVALLAISTVRVVDASTIYADVRWKQFS